MRNGDCTAREMIYEAMIPNIIPKTPPVNVKRIDSVKNCTIMIFFLAPSAFRRPISRVRSVTVTSMMFMMPMPPTKSEIAAIPERSEVNVPVVAEAVLRISCWEKIEKSACAGLLNLCRARRKYPTSSCAADITPELFASKPMELT